MTVGTQEERQQLKLSPQKRNEEGSLFGFSLLPNISSLPVLSLYMLLSVTPMSSSRDTQWIKEGAEGHPTKLRLSYKSISYILTFFNFVLLLIVVCSPCWFTYYAHVDLYYMGLWIICSEKFVCRVMKDADAYMIICRVLLMLGLIASVTSLLWMWLIKRNKLGGCPFRCPSQALMASTLNFTAGLSMLGAMLIFELKINDEDLTPAPKKKWAFYLSYIILILWFFIGIYNLVCYKYSFWEGAAYSGKLSSPKMAQKEEQLQRSLEQIDQNPG